MPYTLVVVDMQAAFQAATKANVIVNVTREIIFAKMRKSAIVFLEYEGSGRTFPALTELTNRYPLRDVCEKWCDDGSSQVLKSLGLRDFPRGRIKVCGVNSNACVLATVNGLAKKLPNSRIEIVRDACEWMGSGQYDWDQNLSYKNLKLV